MSAPPLGILAGLRHGLSHLFRRGAADPALPHHPGAEEEIFVLTGTLLWGIMIQVAMDYPVHRQPGDDAPLFPGVVNMLGVRTPRNEILIAVICWVVIGLLWLLVNRTRAGKQLRPPRSIRAA